MGTHHILKDGTSYAIKGGTDLVNGTKYHIGGGRTPIDGTVYEIGFGPKICTLTITGLDDSSSTSQTTAKDSNNNRLYNGTYEFEVGATIILKVWSYYNNSIYVDGELVASNSGGSLNYNLQLTKTKTTITGGFRRIDVTTG